MKLPGRCSVSLGYLATLCVLSTLTGGGVDAHGFLTVPAVEFRSTQEDPTAYSATIDGTTALPVPAGMHFDWGPTLAAEAFSVAFGSSAYGSLREFAMQHQTMQPSKAISPECGRTKADASVLQALPDEVVWQHGHNEGFTLSHEGPCEVWCDDERVFAEKNCAKTYPHVPAKLPYERAKCEGKSRLQMVWLALHEWPRWQVYMNCAPLAGASTATVASKKQLTSPTVAPSNFSAGTVGPSAQISIAPTVAPSLSTPTMKTTWPYPGSNSTSNGTTEHHLSTRPPMAPANKPVTHLPSEAGVASHDGSASSDVDEMECAQQVPTTPTVTRFIHRATSRPRPLASPPPRRVAEDDNQGEHGSRYDEEKIIESRNPFAEKATGPVPQEIYEEARKDFEEQQKRKEARHAALKKEFGYA